ncbi:TIGR01777 family oxidoreductase [bacterium]|nr:TIGR01777 family oxidoreductase [bacterium]MDC1222079.1 TIGR01777 family oxidoreductase [Salibacteraceae bacterium]
MKEKKIVIAGGSGFLGQILTEYFTDRGVEIVVLTRGANEQKNGANYVNWNGRSLDTWRTHLEGTDALINLSGKSVNCRYTKENKQLIYNSRLESTRVLGLALMKAKNGPKTWINTTSATIYRHADRPMTESNGVHGVGFSVDVCEKWERMFFSFDMPQLRKVAMRTTIVLGKEGGAFLPLRNLANLGLGGRHGNGKQMFSWIHAYDFCRAIGFAIENNEVNGIVNLGAPEQVNNAELMHELRDAVDAPFGLPSPKWLLEVGAMFMGTETELLLKSRWIEPEKLKEAGFHWEFPTLEKALAELCTKDLFAASVSKPLVAH